ncbi:MAG: DUF6788 family protein [Terriglobia bacterium]|jgi:hypothetical protein
MGGSYCLSALVTDRQEDFINPASPPWEELPSRARELKARLAQIGEMRPGSLVERYRKCGKPNCHCARRGDRGHGPLWMVTHALEGKTVSKAIPARPAVERTRPRRGANL